MKQQFIVNGKQIHLNSGQVVSALKNVRPGQVQTHAVEINSLQYPVKQAFSCVTGLDLLDFTTNQARTIFRHLGFRVIRVG